MRRPTETVYSIAFRVQALVGLLLVCWLFTAVFAAGQSAGIALIVGVFAGVASLACLMPYLTPGWLARPDRRSQFLPLVLTHFALMLLYGFVALSAYVAADIAADLNRQLVLGALAILALTALLGSVAGGAMCFANQGDSEAHTGSTVTELVLPRASAYELSDTGRKVDEAALSRAS